MMTRLLVSLLCLSAFAASRPALAEVPLSFPVVRDGTKPAMSPSEFAASKQIVLNDIGQFRTRFLSSAVVVAKTDLQCRRFARAELKVLTQLRETLQRLVSNASLDQLSDDDFQTRFHLDLLHFANLNLYTLFHEERERDYSALDTAVHESCAFTDRPTLMALYDRMIHDMIVLRADGFGILGIKTLDRATDRLAKLAQATARKRNIHSDILFAFNIATVAGVFFMPALAGRIPFLIEETIRRYVVPSVQLAHGSLSIPIEVGLFAADFGGNMMLSNYLQPTEDTRKNNYGLSWEDTLKEVEVVIDSPESYTQVALAYLGEIKQEASKFFRPYLEQNVMRFERAYGNEFEELLGLADEWKQLENRPLRDQVIRLEQILNDHYGYQITCREGSYKNLYIGSVSDLDCFVALRTFARLAYANAIPPLTEAARAALNFEFTKNTSEFDQTAEPFHPTLDASSDPAQMYRFIQSVVSHPAVQQRLVDNQRFANLANTFSLNAGLPVSADNSLTSTSRWRGLINLATIAEHEPELLQNLSIEEIRLQPAFEPLADYGLKLRFGIAADASLEQVESFLKQQVANPNRTARIARFESESEEARSVVERIKSRGFDADCSSAGELTLAGCIKTLIVVDQILAQISPKYFHPTEIAKIFVAGRDEMPDASEMERFGGAEKWHVREGSQGLELMLFLREHGWIHADTSAVCNFDGDAKPCTGGD